MAKEAFQLSVDGCAVAPPRDTCAEACEDAVAQGYGRRLPDGRVFLDREADISRGYQGELD